MSHHLIKFIALFLAVCAQVGLAVEHIIELGCSDMRGQAVPNINIELTIGTNANAGLDSNKRSAHRQLRKGYIHLDESVTWGRYNPRLGQGFVVNGSVIKSSQPVTPSTGPAVVLRDLMTLSVPANEDISKIVIRVQTSYAGEGKSLTSASTFPLKRILDHPSIVIKTHRDPRDSNRVLSISAGVTTGFPVTAQNRPLFGPDVPEGKRVTTSFRIKNGYEGFNQCSVM